MYSFKIALVISENVHIAFLYVLRRITCRVNGFALNIDPGYSIEPPQGSTGVQLKSETKLSTVIGLITKHADLRMIFKS